MNFGKMSSMKNDLYEHSCHTADLPDIHPKPRVRSTTSGRTSEKMFMRESVGLPKRSTSYDGPHEMRDEASHSNPSEARQRRRQLKAIVAAEKRTSDVSHVPYGHLDTDDLEEEDTPNPSQAKRMLNFQSGKHPYLSSLNDGRGDVGSPNEEGNFPKIMGHELEDVKTEPLISPRSKQTLEVGEYNPENHRTGEILNNQVGDTDALGNADWEDNASSETKTYKIDDFEKKHAVSRQSKFTPESTDQKCERRSSVHGATPKRDRSKHGNYLHTGEGRKRRQSDSRRGTLEQEEKEIHSLKEKKKDDKPSTAGSRSHTKMKKAALRPSPSDLITSIKKMSIKVMARDEWEGGTLPPKVTVPSTSIMNQSFIQSHDSGFMQARENNNPAPMADLVPALPAEAIPTEEDPPQEEFPAPHVRQPSVVFEGDRDYNRDDWLRELSGHNARYQGDEVFGVTPTMISVQVQTYCTSFYTLCHGLFGGLALAHLIMLMCTFSFAQDVVADAGHINSKYAISIQALFAFFSTVCMLSILDRYDIHAWRDFKWRYILGPSLFLDIFVVIIYVATFIVNVCAVQWDDRVSLQSDNATLWDNPEIVAEVSHWKILSILRCVGAILGWMFVNVSLEGSFLYTQLNIMDQYERRGQLCD